MTKPGYHQKSNQPHGQARHYLQVGGFNQPQPIGGGPGGAGETKSAPRQASPRQEVGKRAGCIPPPGYSDIHAQSRSRCGTASPSTEILLYGPVRRGEPMVLSRSGQSKSSKPARVVRDRAGVIFEGSEAMASMITDSPGSGKAALSIDVEDWFHAANLGVARQAWEQCEFRVER